MNAIGNSLRLFFIIAIIIFNKYLTKSLSGSRRTSSCCNCKISRCLNKCKGCLYEINTQKSAAVIRFKYTLYMCILSVKKKKS